MNGASTYAMNSSMIREPTKVMTSIGSLVGEVKIGVIFYGSEGRLEIDDAGNWKTYLGPKGEPGPNSKSIVEEKSDAMNPVGSGMSGHFGNFIDSVLAHNQEKLNCDIEEGHLSSTLPHLANIAYRVKRPLRFDPKTETFPGDAEANRLLTREYRAPFRIPDRV